MGNKLSTNLFCALALLLCRRAIARCALFVTSPLMLCATNMTTTRSGFVDKSCTHTHTTPAFGIPLRHSMACVCLHSTWWQVQFVVGFVNDDWVSLWPQHTHVVRNYISLANRQIRDCLRFATIACEFAHAPTQTR